MRFVLAIILAALLAPVMSSAAPAGCEYLLLNTRKTVASLNNFWEAELQALNIPFRPMKKVEFFAESIKTGCGEHPASTGPLYCFDDGIVYIPVEFWAKIMANFPQLAPGALALIISHEYGHHVQWLAGIEGTLWEMLSTQKVFSDDPVALERKISKLTELGADGLSGRWLRHAHRSRQIRDEDYQAALMFIQTMGDESHAPPADTPLNVVYSRDHGSGFERYMWLERGYASESVKDLSVFKQPDLLQGLPGELPASLPKLFENWSNRHAYPAHP